KYEYFSRIGGNFEQFHRDSNPFNLEVFSIINLFSIELFDRNFEMNSNNFKADIIKINPAITKKDLQAILDVLNHANQNIGSLEIYDATKQNKNVQKVSSALKSSWKMIRMIL
ncbi:hypothetical protein SSS_10644, partial [Sarcoptes scabiei]